MFGIEFFMDITNWTKIFRAYKNKSLEFAVKYNLYVKLLYIFMNCFFTKITVFKSMNCFI